MIRPRMLSGMGASVGVRHTGSGGVWSAGRRDFQQRIAAALARSQAAHERKMLQTCRHQAVTLGHSQMARVVGYLALGVIGCQSRRLEFRETLESQLPRGIASRWLLCDDIADRSECCYPGPAWTAVERNTQQPHRAPTQHQLHRLPAAFCPFPARERRNGTRNPRLCAFCFDRAEAAARPITASN